MSLLARRAYPPSFAGHHRPGEMRFPKSLLEKRQEMARKFAGQRLDCQVMLAGGSRSEHRCRRFLHDGVCWHGLRLLPTMGHHFRLVRHNGTTSNEFACSCGKIWSPTQDNGPLSPHDTFWPYHD